MEAIRSLALKFPSKQRALMAFLAGALREEGGFEYKKAIVSSILQLIQVRFTALSRRRQPLRPDACLPRLLL